MSKQYLMMLNEEHLETIRKVSGNIVQFLEVQGMDLNGNDKYKLLVAPVIPPVAAMTPEPMQVQNQVEHVPE